MCFGNNQTVDTKVGTTSGATSGSTAGATSGSTSNITQLPSWLTNAAQGNVANAQNLNLTNYTQPLTAGQTADQSAANAQLRTIAGSSNPYLSSIQGLYNQFSSAPGTTVSAPSVLGAGVNPATASLSDYMSPYTSAALQPVLDDIQRQSQQNQKGINASSTMAGAFGDSRQGVAEGMNDFNTGKLRDAAIGTGYQNAFTAASGLRNTDVSNLINNQVQTGNFNEQALNRAATGASDLTNLDLSQTGRAVDTANALGTAGAAEQATNQAGLSANYQEFLRQQGWAPQQIALLNSTLSSAPHDTSTSGTTSGTTAGTTSGSTTGNSNTTDSKPDTSGFGLLASILGAGASGLTGGSSGLLGSLLSGLFGGGAGGSGSPGGGSPSGQTSGGGAPTTIYDYA